MRIISDPFEGITSTIAFQIPVNANYIAETGDVLATGSNQVITGTSSIIFLDKEAGGAYIVPPSTEFYFGARWKSRNVSKVWAASGTTNNHRIFQWLDNSLASLGYLRVNPISHVLEIRDSGDALLADSGSVTVTNLINYHIEMRVLMDAVTGVINVNLNGASVISYTGNTGANPIALILLLGPGIAPGDIDATLGHWFDDVYINDTSNADGKGDIGFAGQIKMIVQLPTADGTYISFSPSPGSNANFQNVNSLSNVINNNFSNNPGLLDSFPVAASGLTNVTITACTTRTLAQSTINPQLMLLGVRQAANDFLPGPSQSVPTTPQLLYDSRFVLNPNTNLAWAVSEADSNEVIYQHAPI